MNYIQFVHGALPLIGLTYTKIAQLGSEFILYTHYTSLLIESCCFVLTQWLFFVCSSVVVVVVGFLSFLYVAKVRVFCVCVRLLSRH